MSLKHSTHYLQFLAKTAHPQVRRWALQELSEIKKWRVLDKTATSHERNFLLHRTRTRRAESVVIITSGCYLTIINPRLILVSNRLKLQKRWWVVRRRTIARSSTSPLPAHTTPNQSRPNGRVKRYQDMLFANNLLTTSWTILKPPTPGFYPTAEKI